MNRKRMGRRKKIKRARDDLNENGPHMLTGGVALFVTDSGL